MTAGKAANIIRILSNKQNRDIGFLVAITSQIKR